MGRKKTSKKTARSKKVSNNKLLFLSIVLLLLVCEALVGLQGQQRNLAEKSSPQQVAGVHTHK